MRFSLLLYSLALALQAWIKLLIPSKNAVVDMRLKPLKNSVPVMPDRASRADHCTQTNDFLIQRLLAFLSG